MPLTAPHLTQIGASLYDGPESYAAKLEMCCPEPGAIKSKVMIRRTSSVPVANSPLPDAATPAAGERSIIAVLAGERTVGHSQGRVGRAIAWRLVARINPTEIHRRKCAAERSGRAIIIVVAPVIGAAGLR